MPRETHPNAQTSGAAPLDAPYTESFHLERMLGQGGVGRVFLAIEKNIGREVAIKELITERLGARTERATTRFIREARISGQLEHPGIVPVYRLDTKPDGTVFYVMKHVQGKTLLHTINEIDLLPAEEALRGRLSLLGDFIAVCDAMSYAHAKGIIHRDLKPSNIILGSFGETIILDWGLAKRLSDPDSHGSAAEVEVVAAPQDDPEGLKTIQGVKLGTPPYMSPEQIDASLGPVDAASDVYALGSILYFILTGEKPYSGTVQAQMEAIASFVPSPSPQREGLPIPPELIVICEKAMAKRREDRFRNSAELAAELKAYRDGRLVGVYSYSRMELLRRFIQHNKVAVGAAIAVFLSVSVGLGFAIHFALVAERAHQQAERALVDVTKLSDQASALARRTAISAAHGFAELQRGMEEEATTIGASGLESAGRVQQRLAALHLRIPEAEAFAIVEPSNAIAVSVPTLSEADLLAVVSAAENVASNFSEHPVVIGDAFRMPGGHEAFLLSVPVRRQGKIAAALTALFRTDRAMPSLFSFDPKTSSYQLWCMRNDGLIVYDEDENQIGRSLFTDAMYAKFPELQAFGERLRSEPWGLGYYSFVGRDGAAIFKIAAWETFTPTAGDELKIVVTYPYREK